MWSTVELILLWLHLFFLPFTWNTEMFSLNYRSSIWLHWLLLRLATRAGHHDWDIVRQFSIVYMEKWRTTSSIGIPNTTCNTFITFLYELTIRTIDYCICTELFLTVLLLYFFYYECTVCLYITLRCEIFRDTSTNLHSLFLSLYCTLHKSRLIVWFMKLEEKSTLTGYTHFYERCWTIVVGNKIMHWYGCTL